MTQSLYDAQYNPDILSCLANLSNDEVFTPPTVANQMIDMLPQELFKNPNAKFLDPACKSGVFLREIAKRLIEGEKDIYPNLNERIDHIMHEQLYGIAITEMTSLMSRRSLYCSKYPNGIFSISKFDQPEGNIRFKNIRHTWENGKCKYCGTSRDVLDRDESLETYAYEFIHILEPKEIFNMKFDVIIGNPPYQLSDGGNKASAKPIYQLFVQQGEKLNPRYLTMIIPARWFSGGKGLDDFRSSMLHDKRIRTLTDYFNSTDCFPGVDISGGICYFLWDRDHPGDCNVQSYRDGKVSKSIRPLLEQGYDTFIRFNEAMSIVRKVQAFKEPLFYKPISSRKPFGIDTTVSVMPQSKSRTVKIYAYPENGYIEKSKVKQNSEWLDKYKVCISYAYGERGSFPYLVIGKPFIIEPGACCSETYIVINRFDNKATAENVISYMCTKFFRFLVLLLKNTQHATRNVYQMVPMQDFSKPWTDKELYKKYGISENEVSFIDSMVRTMDLTIDGLNDGGDD